MFLAWGKFFLMLLLIFHFGRKAAVSADIISEKKNWGKAFMGVVFISMITSFPELFTGISAVTIVNSSDMAVGELLGSCLFNLLIIALVEVLFRKRNIYLPECRENILPLIGGMVMLLLVIAAILFPGFLKFAHLSFFSFMLGGVYLYVIYRMFAKRKCVQETHDYSDRSLGREATVFVFSSIVIIGVGIWLPVVGKEIAILMDWNDSFVGVVFLALVTSFPELVVSLETARMGAFDMLVGNIAGSNLFNLAIILIIDIVYFRSPIFLRVAPVQMKTAVIGLIMSSIVLLAIIKGKSPRLGKSVRLAGLLLILLYSFNLILVY